MRLEEFRNLVKREFGENLRHATPGNVRDFLDRIENEVLSEKVSHRIVLNEPCTSYEEIIKDFFSQMLELPPEEAVVGLWALALDLAFASIESQYTDRFASLFKDME
ncbi:MAG: hypothetical protein ACOX3G_03515 [Armatimonadota bacterium]|nr:hypothetical protein [Armatimonadota bacterium]